jgi:putative glutamine amidotransferase
VQADGYDEPRDAISHDWIKYLSQLRITPIMIPNNLKDLDGFLDNVEIQGLILTGGNDISPETYENIELNDGNDAEPIRDRNEFALLDYCITNHIPVLGVCRGAQIINLYFEGGVSLPEKRGSHIAQPHIVYFSGSQAVKRFGVDKCEVNSFHRYVITKELLASEIKVLCRAEDDTIEGFHHRQLPIFGICWHPERPGSNRNVDLKLLEILFHLGSSNDNSTEQQNNIIEA